MKSLALLDVKSTKMCEKKSMKIYKKNLWKSTAKTQTQTQNTNFFCDFLLFCFFGFSFFIAGALYWLYSTCFFTFSLKDFFSLFFCFGVFFKRELYTAVSELVFFSFRLKDFFSKLTQLRLTQPNSPQLNPTHIRSKQVNPTKSN